MIKLKIFTVSFLCLCFSSALQSQVTVEALQLKPEKKLPITYSPFNKFEILDNRFDTTRLYTYETGDYWPVSLGLEQPAGTAIEKYLEERIFSIPKGNKTLLINIEQLRVPNKRRIQRKKVVARSNGWQNMRYLMVSIQAYERQGGY